VGTAQAAHHLPDAGAEARPHPAECAINKNQATSERKTMKNSPIPYVILGLISLSLPACHTHAEGQSPQEHNKIVVTSPMAKDIIITQPYVCQIRSQRHIDVCALANGFLEEIPVKEGQAVKKGDLMFKILPTLYQAKLDAELAEVQLAERERDNTKRLFDQKVVSIQELLLYEAKLAKAQAKANLAKAELNFCTVRAPFDGIIDRLLKQHGSVINEKEILTTLSDNSVMWVYFNVPEARYLQYMTEILGQNYKKLDYQARLKTFLAEMNRRARIELVLADGSKFPQIGTIGTIEARFNNENGNISFRADFPNPERLLRHGMTGNVLINRTLKDAIVIPQRATFEILDRRYVYVVGKDDKVHQREIAVQHELEDIFVISRGLAVDDRFVYEGGRQLREDAKVEYDFLPPEQIIGHQKQHAE